MNAKPFESTGKMTPLDLRPQFAEIVVQRAHGLYWVVFDMNPGLRRGDPILLMTGDKVVGCALVSHVTKDPSGRWIVHWEGASFEFAN